MATIASIDLASILDNYADAIEGGNSYRGSGTAYYGCPGRYSNKPDMRASASANLITLTGAGHTTTTTIIPSSYTWNGDDFVKEETPPWFLQCATLSTNPDTSILNSARKISAWNSSTLTFTHAAFSSAMLSGQSLYLREGFKRLPNHLDFEEEGPEIKDGYDRFFELTALPGEHLKHFGNGFITYKTTMELRLRILKYGRSRDAINSALENLFIIRNIIIKGGNPINHRPNGVRALLAQDTQPKILREDRTKVVAVDSFDLIYSVDATLL